MPSSSVARIRGLSSLVCEATSLGWKKQCLEKALDHDFMNGMVLAATAYSTYGPNIFLYDWDIICFDVPKS